MKRFTFLLTALAVTLSFSQIKGQTLKNPWTDIPESSIPNPSERYIIPNQYRTVQVDLEKLQQTLTNVPKEFNTANSTRTISLPMPDGSIRDYQIVETSVMAPGLAVKYPEIRTFKGVQINDGTESIRLDITHQGFHAMIRSPEGTSHDRPLQHEYNGILYLLPKKGPNKT